MSKEERENLLTKAEAYDTDKILTIPNILTFLRIAAIPFFIFLYVRVPNEGGGLDFLPAIGVLAFIEASDIIDGIIARKFHLVSRLGKALDPVADKLSQIAIFVCLSFRYPILWLPLVLLTVKELISGLVGLFVIKKTGRVLGAVWHGKLTTVCIFTTVGFHFLWGFFPGWNTPVPTVISHTLVLLCVGMMVLSFTLYMIRYSLLLKESKSNE